MAKQIASFYAPFRVQQAAIAPDGRHVAFILAAERGIEVQVIDLDRPEARRRFPLDERAEAAASLLVWSTSDRLIAASDSPVMVGIDVSTGAQQRVTDSAAPRGSPRPGGPRGRSGAGPGAPARTARVLGAAPDYPDSVLVEAISPRPLVAEDASDPASDAFAANDVTLDVYRLDLRTSERVRILQRTLPAPGGSVILDQQGTPRLIFQRGTLPQRFFYRAPEPRAEWMDLDRVLDDRKHFAFAVTPENFSGARTIPLGFDAEPNLLYYASNLERDTFGIYAIDLRTGKRTPGGVEEKLVDLVGADMPWKRSPLRFDRKLRRLVGVRIDGLETSTTWLDAALESVQTTLAGKFPGRRVHLLDWDDARDRFVVHVSTASDPGRYFVYHPSADRCVEFFRRMPGLAVDDTHATEPFAFVTPTGASISGTITMPRTPPIPNPALVIWLRDTMSPRIAPDFDRDAQALAAMGFLVAQVNYSGSPGFGRAGRDALRRDLDRKPIADVLAALEWLARHHRFDRARVALVGEGFGGYVALRALQLQRESFLCAVAIDAPVDLNDLKKRGFQADPTLRGLMAGAEQKSLASFGEAGEQQPDEIRTPVSARPESNPAADADRVDFESEYRRWFVSGQPRLNDIAVTKNPEALTRSVLLLHQPNARYAPIASVRGLRDALVRRKLPVTYLERTGPTGSRAETIQRIGEFLNANVYEFTVQVGKMTEKD